MVKHVAGAAAAAAALLVASAAQSAVTVIGGGLAQNCSEAAKAGDASLQAEKTCTGALEGELLATLDRAGTYVNRGIIKLRRQNYDQAIADFDIALKTKPDLAEAFVNRGAARIGKHQFKESVADLNKALELGVPEPEKAYYNRALAYEWLDDMKSAYLDYRKAMEIAPAWELVQQQLTRFTVNNPEAAAAAAAERR
jgi:tetratricopeptide (TPR) repeat protein